MLGLVRQVLSPLARRAFCQDSLLQGDLPIRALAGELPTGALRIRHVQIFNSTAYSKACVLYDTFDIFCTFGAHWRSQWQYLVIWRFIFSERVVIFAAFVD